MRKLFVIILLISSLYFLSVETANHADEKSPYYQHLPDCSKREYKNVTKQTSIKGIVCPMVKDEVGFLSEWIAFYEMQGFNHVILYDNNSTLPINEVQPWIDMGFVTIRRDWWQGKRNLFINPSKKYYDMMAVKLLAEAECKEIAVKMGIEIFVSLDLDEYLFPSVDSMTVMDQLANWFNVTTRGYVNIEKMNFPSTPHLQEPIGLLTIEAYQSRMNSPNRMNYYTGVSNKVALRLFGGPEYTEETTEMMVKCCDFHGCNNRNFFKQCGALLNSQSGRITGKHRKFLQAPHIHHYGRSLEKYMLKQRSWDTASHQGNYDIYNFMDRTSGFTFDNSALSWSCQLRDLLLLRTGEPYVRPGDMWYKNPEYGKTVSDPKKRGRYGNAFGKVLSTNEMNPYPPGETYQAAHKPYKPPSLA